MLDEKNKELDVAKQNSLETNNTSEEVDKGKILDTFATVTEVKDLEFTIQRLSELKWLQTHYATLGLGSWSEANIKIEKLSQVRYDELHEYMPILYLLPIEDHQTISFEVTDVEASAFEIDKVTEMSEFNSKLALLDSVNATRSADILYSISFKAPNIGNEEITNIDDAFKGNTHLKQLDILSEFKNVNSAKRTFKDCTNLKFVNGIAFLPKVTDTTSMFEGCTSLENPTDGKENVLDTLNVSGLSKLTIAEKMFSGCSLLSDVAGLSSWKAVTNIKNIFSNCKKLNNLSCKLPSVTNAFSAFSGCTSLTTFEYIDFSHLDNASHMFEDCTSLPTLNISTFQNVTNASYMFKGCTSFEITDDDKSIAYLKPLVDNASESNVLNNAEGMFIGCTSITSVDIRGLLALSNINFSHLFENCKGLKTIYWGAKHPAIEEPRTANKNKANYEKMLLGTEKLTIDVDDEVLSEENLADNGLHSIIWIAHRIFNCHEKQATLTPATEDLGDLGVSRADFYNYTFKISSSSYPTKIPLNELWIWQSIIEPDATVDRYKLMVEKVTSRGVHVNKDGKWERGDLSQAINLYKGVNLFELSFKILKEDASTTSFNFDNSFKGDYKIYSVTPSIEGVSSTDLPINVDSATSMFEGCKELYSFPGYDPNTQTFDQINFNFIEANSMFKDCGKLNVIDTSKFLNLTHAEKMFMSSGLTTINCSGFTKVTECESMFARCTSLGEVKIDYGAKKPDGTLIENGFGKVTNATSMFSGCSALYNITNAGVFENVTNIDNMFNGCSVLRSLNASTMTKVTDAVSAFENCSKLDDLGETKFENLETATRMFCGCSSLPEDKANLLQFTSVKDADSMFESCTSFKKVDLSSFGASDYSVMNDRDIKPSEILSDTLYLENSQNMFKDCNNLQTIKLGFSYKRVNPFKDMFSGISPEPKFEIQSKREKKWLTDNWEDLGLLKELEESNFSTIIIEEMSFNFYMTEYLNVITQSIIGKNFQLKNVATAEVCQKDGKFNSKYFSGTDTIKSLFNEKFNEEASRTGYRLSFDLPACGKDEKCPTASVTTIDYCIYNNTKIKVINFIHKDTKDPVTDITSANHAFEGCSALTFTDTHMFSKITSADSMFKDCTSLNTTNIENSTIDVTKFINVKTATSMFEGCKAIESFKNDGNSFSQTTNAKSMFKNCTSLSTISTSKCFGSVSNATSMFEECTALLSVGLKYFNSILYVDKMFKNCKRISSIDVIQFGRNLSTIDNSKEPIQNVTSAIETFFGCESLANVKNPEYLCKITNANSMFKGCKSLGADPKTETSHLYLYKDFVEDEYNAYDEEFDADFKKPEPEGHMPFENVIDASHMFEGCTGLKKANLTYARKLQNTEAMFKGCKILSETQIDTVYQNEKLHFNEMYADTSTDPNLVFKVKRFTERSWIIDKFEELTGKALNPSEKTAKFKTLLFKSIPYRNLCEYFPIIEKESKAALTIIQVNDPRNLKNRYAEESDFYVDNRHSKAYYKTELLSAADKGQTSLLGTDLKYTGTGMNGRKDEGNISLNAGKPHCSWFGSQFIWFETLDPNYSSTHELSTDLRRDKDSSMNIELDMVLDGAIGNSLTSISYCFNDLTGIFKDIKITHLSDENNLKYAHGAFRNVSTLENCDTGIFQNVEQSMSAFEGCKSLTTIDTLDFKHIICAYRMFKGSGVNSLFEIGNKGVFVEVELASEMFMNCEALQTADTRNFTEVKQAESMFENCSSLTHLSLESFKAVENVKEMLKGCTDLNSLSISIDHQKCLSEIAKDDKPKYDETAYETEYSGLFDMLRGINNLSYIAVEDASSTEDVMKIAKWYYNWRHVLGLYMEYVSFTNSLKIVYKFCAMSSKQPQDIVPENRYIKGYTDIDGKVNLNHSQYLDDADGVLNLNNSNIYNINGLHFGRSDRLDEGTDPSDPTKDPKKKIVFAKGAEGIQFDRNDGDADKAKNKKGKADSFWNDSNGGLFYSPNREFGSEAKANRMIESKHFNSSITSGFVDTIYSTDGNLNTQVIPNNTDYNKNDESYIWQITSVDYIIEK